MLIGILGHVSEERNDFSSFEYQCQVLQRCQLLPKTDTQSTLENVLETLRTFRNEWHRYQQFLVPFDVCRATGLCPDVVIEISKYLSLAEAINAFSTSILPLLRQTRCKVHLNDPPTRLLQIVTEHLDPRQITSVRIVDDVRRPAPDLSAFRMFDQLVSVKIVIEQPQQMISRLLPYFPNIRHLALVLTAELNPTFFTDLGWLYSYPFTDLYICWGHVRFNDFAKRIRYDGDFKNTTITSFALDSTSKETTLFGAPFPLRLELSHFLHFSVQLIGSLTNVRRIRLVASQYQLGIYFRVHLWQQVIAKCVHLNRVVIHVYDSERYRQEALSIEQTLRRSRPRITFRVKNI